MLSISFSECSYNYKILFTRQVESQSNQQAQLQDDFCREGNFGANFGGMPGGNTVPKQKAHPERVDFLF